MIPIRPLYYYYRYSSCLRIRGLVELLSIGGCPGLCWEFRMPEDFTVSARFSITASTLTYSLGPPRQLPPPAYEYNYSIRTGIEYSIYGEEST